jgi:hypothetical protein
MPAVNSLLGADASTADVLIARRIICDLMASREHDPDRVSFDQEWDLFIGAARVLTPGANSPTHDDAAKALNRFLQVIMGEYEDKEAFKTTLFRELRASLGGFCGDVGEVVGSPVAMSSSTAGSDDEESSARSESDSDDEVVSYRIMLKGSRVGFVTDFGLGKDSRSDMACVVYRGDACDMTATVELELSNTACKPYEISLDLKTAHAPMAKALLLGTDVWYSLARRGYKEEPRGPVTISAVVLASNKKKAERGKSRAAPSSKKRKAKNRRPHLCCMEAFLTIPTQLGGRFRYRVNHCVTVPPLSNDEQDEENAYKEALAVFIKTLRIGLTRAQALLEDKGAVSLCCSPPRDDLLLIASPIPLAAVTRVAGMPDVTVTQGELYRVKDTSVNVQTWILEIEETKVHVFDGATISSAQSLVKISFGSVHGSLVPVADNWAALNCIAGSGIVKDTLANILLACAFVNSLCLVTVMRMVTPGLAVGPPDAFDTHRRCWEAFRRLTISTLLPMADIGVVHNDIRYDPETLCFSNIILDDNEEFRMIDFESLVILSNEASDLPLQDHAISLMHRLFRSAHEFVLWQVLWAAYVWYPRSQSEAITTALEFVEEFSSQRLRGFTDWIQNYSQNGLDTIYRNLTGTTKAGVEQPLDIISGVFERSQWTIGQLWTVSATRDRIY